MFDNRFIDVTVARQCSFEDFAPLVEGHAR
jgi:hypothetical protein